MIVKPDFPEHWKTRLLVKITKDESAPMALIRLWAHCQNSHRWEFPDMTPKQLDSVCHWGDRKPACHTALIKTGFVDRLSPKGFAAHGWNEHNAQMIQKWQAGAKGGRPQTENPRGSEKFSQNSENFQTPPEQTESKNLDKTDEYAKPTDNRPPTGTKPDRSDRPDRSDQMRSKRSDQTDRGQLAASNTAPHLPAAVDGLDSKSSEAGLDLGGLVSGLASKMTTCPGYAPTLSQVKTAFSFFFAGAEKYAEPFYRTMEKQHWRDKEGKLITNWKAMGKSYASKAAMSHTT